jgi:hypothetical protein
VVPIWLEFLLEDTSGSVLIFRAFKKVENYRNAGGENVMFFHFSNFCVMFISQENIGHGCFL